MNESNPRLSEGQARRLWDRAAELQAEAARREEEAGQDEGASEGSAELVAGNTDAGYSLTHVRQAGMEVGIQGDFFDLALAEDAVLELEGGSRERGYDRAMQRFLKDRRKALEVRKQYAFPPRDVWMALEKTLCNPPNGFAMMDVPGGGPEEGFIAIFESPPYRVADDSLRFWSAAADTKRYVVRVTPLEGKEGCEALIRVPLRRSRRITGAVGLGLIGALGVGGGAIGLVVAGGMVAGGLGALPLGLILAGAGLGGSAGAAGLTRYGLQRTYPRVLRGLEGALGKTLNRVRRDLERAADSR